MGQSASSQDLTSDGKPKVRKLMITRTFRDETEGGVCLSLTLRQCWAEMILTYIWCVLGHIYTRTEEVTKPQVIEAYLKIRKNKSPEFMSVFPFYQFPFYHGNDNFHDCYSLAVNFAVSSSQASMRIRRKK